MSEEGGRGRGSRRRGGAGRRWRMHNTLAVHFRHRGTNPSIQRTNLHQKCKCSSYEFSEFLCACVQTLLLLHVAHFNHGTATVSKLRRDSEREINLLGFKKSDEKRLWEAQSSGNLVFFFQKGVKNNESKSNCKTRTEDNNVKCKGNRSDESLLSCLLNRVEKNVHVCVCVHVRQCSLHIDVRV